MTILLKITKEDIEKGIRRSFNKCPIVRAATRHYNCPAYIAFGQIWLGKLRHGIRGRSLPQKAMDFIEAYDEGRPVKPFSFRLPKNLAIGN